MGIAAKAFGAGAKALGIIGQATRAVGAYQSLEGVRDAVAHGAGIPQLIDGARRLARGDVGGGFAALADGALGLAGAAASVKGAASLAGRYAPCQEKRIFPWNSNQNSCFTAGTLIKLPDGSSMPIEQFRPGDAILTKDEFRPESAAVAGVVVDTFTRVSPVLHVRVKGVTIETTAEHPLWVVGRGWIPVVEVRAGDELLTSDGRAVVCDGVDRTGRVETVYNVTVVSGHTYFVGHEVWGFDVWAHNAGGVKYGKKQIKVPGKNPNKLKGYQVDTPTKGMGGAYTGPKDGKIQTGSTDNFSQRYIKYPENGFRITTEYPQTKFSKPPGVDDSKYKWTDRRQRRFDEEYLDRTLPPEQRFRKPKGDSPVSKEKWRDFRHIFGYGDVDVNFGY